MTWTITQKLQALAVSARRPLSRPEVPAKPDVAIAPDTAHENAPVASAVHVPPRRRIGKISERMSHALFIGLVAVALLPPVQPNAALKQALPLRENISNPKSDSAERNDTRAPAVDNHTINERAVPLQVVPMPMPPKPQSAPAETGAPVKKSAADVAPVVTAAIVAPVKRELPRPVAITVIPDEPRRADLKLPKQKKKVVRARLGTPDVVVKAEAPPRTSIVFASVSLSSISATEPETLALARENLPKLKAKTVSERKAKPIEAVKPERVAALEPPAAARALPPAGVATRGEETTVIDAWSADQIAEGRKACQSLLKDSDIVASEAPPLKEGACGAPAPVIVKRLGAPKVDIQPAAMLTCQMASSLNTWITKTVQPAAIEAFGVPVVQLLSASSYACRNRYGQSNTPLSEHALVNALDLSGFVLADGRTIRVVDGWGAVARDAKPTEPVEVASANSSSKPGIMRLGVDGAATAPQPATSTPNDKQIESSKRAAFLHKVHKDACGTFGTVLGPEANDAHRNHFHLDMMARRRTPYCQ